jgi:hypothetical protein
VYQDASKNIVYLRYDQHFLKITLIYHNKMFFKLYDNKPENKSTLDKRKNGQHVFEMVKTYMSSLEKIILMGQREIEVRLMSLAYFSRSSSFSLSIHHIGRTWSSLIPSMVCT